MHLNPRKKTTERPRSLRLRLGLILVAMTVLALFSMGASIYIAETAQDDAAAINKAGSLRMQSYRIAALLQGEASAAEITAAREQFGAILEAPALTKTTEEAGAAPGRHYREVRRTWEDILAPDLQAVIDNGHNGGALYLTEVGNFVTSVDTMVVALQRQAEQRIQWLRLSQGAAVVLTLTLALTAVYLIHTGIMRPLAALMSMAERVRHGDFSDRVRHTRRDEIGLLGRSFNTMAADLETLHAGLERQVELKTRELRRSNEALQLLYDAARTLTPGRVDEDTVCRILQHLSRVTDIRLITVCIADPDERTVRHTFSSVRGHEPAFCRSPDCSRCLRGNVARIRGGISESVATIPLEDRDEQYGVMLLEYAQGRIPEQWKFRLADAVAEKIAVAIGLAREERRQRRLALLEERSVIARELHDSLAQSLSYLKIQVTRLEAGLRDQTTSATTTSAVTELREGLNTAYGHLRELRTTFRLKMNEPGLTAALRAAAEEYRQRSEGTEILLEQLDGGLSLDSNAEIHVLHITREALANVVNHARAAHAWIRLYGENDGWVTLSVDDDGIGLPDQHDRPHHYGIRIMTERANSLGGTLTMSRREPNGTHLEVRFPARDETVTESVV